MKFSGGVPVAHFGNAPAPEIRADELEVNPDFQCHHRDHDAGRKCGEHGCGGGICHCCRPDGKKRDYYTAFISYFAKAEYIMRIIFLGSTA